MKHIPYNLIACSSVIVTVLTLVGGIDAGDIAEK